MWRTEKTQRTYKPPSPPRPVRLFQEIVHSHPLRATFTTMHILILVAGTNHPSNSETLANCFAEGIRLSQPHTTITSLRLDSLDIAHFDIAHYETSTDQGKDFLMLKEEILKADGVVIASPIWNFSVPAHLKNLMDRIGSFALDETHSVGTLKGKPFYLLYTGGAPAAAWVAYKKTTSHMDFCIRYFGGTVIGSHYEGRATAGRGIFKEVLSGRPECLRTVVEKGKQFGSVVAAFAKNGTLPATQAFLAWIFGMGGKAKKMMGL